jgi:phosphoglucosamine mutase
VPFLRAKVGDRYVLESLEQHGWLFGGESSGHLICLDKHTTGDGIVSALQVLAAVRRIGCSLADLTQELQMLAQTMINVQVPAGFAWKEHAPLTRELERVQAEIHGRGRVLVRPSGTEPVLRVMVEAADPELARTLAQRLAATVVA